MKFNIKQIFSSAAVAAAILCVGAADATPLSFSLTGDKFSASWVMDSQPAPDSVVSGVLVSLWTSGNFNYLPGNKAFITFYSNDNFGGLRIDGTGDLHSSTLFIMDVIGPQLYSGAEGAPVFAPGTYALSGYGAGHDTEGYWDYTLSVSAVPEGETYSMLLVGLGVVGVVVRRRKKRM